MKGKTRLAALFGVVALGLTAAGTSLQAQQAPPAAGPDAETAKVLQVAGVSYEDAKAVAGGRNPVAYFDPELYEGEAYASFNATTCWVQWAWNGNEGLATGFSDADAKAIPLRYDSATVDRDMARITLLHELSHCGQHPSDEYDADEKAITWFLAHGGDSNSAKYWIYWRAAGSLLDNKRYGSQNNHFGLASKLYAKFFGGPDMDPEASRKAIVRALEAMQAYGGDGPQKDTWLVNGKKMSRTLIDDMLADQSLKLDAEVRQILEISRDAYKFLAEGPPAQKADARISVLPPPMTTLAL